jgi:hypothetical protein
MEKSLKREFEILCLAFNHFGPMPDELVEQMSPDLQALPGTPGPELRTWLAQRYGVSKTGNLRVALEKRLKEVSKRQGRAYRLDKLRRTLSRLEMQVRGDPEQFDADYDAAVRGLLDLQ